MGVGFMSIMHGIYVLKFPTFECNNVSWVSSLRLQIYRGNTTYEIVWSKGEEKTGHLSRSFSESF